MRRIDALYMECPLYGSRQMARHLRHEGMVAGRHRVRRLMRRMGLEAVCPKPRTSQPHPQHKVYPYRLRDVTGAAFSTAFPPALFMLGGIAPVKNATGRPPRRALTRWRPPATLTFEGIDNERNTP